MCDVVNTKNLRFYHFMTDKDFLLSIELILIGFDI